MPTEEIRNEQVEQLLSALKEMNDADEIFALLLDLCTPREIEEMSRRLEVARMLDAGSSYSCVQDATGVSATTISRVSRCLAYGSGGYKSALRALKADSSGSLGKEQG